MTELCEKHGPYSTICRACDLETIAERHAVPTPSAVEQVDRDAVAALMEASEPGFVASMTRQGHRDSDPIVQAFARHRQAGLVEAAGIAERFRNDCEGERGSAAWDIQDAILAAAGRS